MKPKQNHKQSAQIVTLSYARYAAMISDDSREKRIYTRSLIILRREFTYGIVWLC